MNMDREEILKAMQKAIEEAWVEIEKMRTIPDVVVEMEMAKRGIIEEYPDSTVYVLTVQEWFDKHIGFSEL